MEVKKKVVQPRKKAQPAKTTNQPRVDSKIREAGKFELKNSDSFFVKFGLVQVDERWLIANKEEGEGIESCWVKFKMWSFEEEVILRSQATQWDGQRRIHTLNNDYFNRLKIQKLMLDWSFSKENENLKLHRVNNVLTDESFWKLFKIT